MEKRKSLREEAIDIIRAGGAVPLRSNGERKIFTTDNLAELPSEADLAIGNSDAENLALDNIETELARLEAAKAKLTAAKKTAKAEEAPAKAVEAPKAEAKKEEDKK